MTLTEQVIAALKAEWEQRKAATTQAIDEGRYADLPTARKHENEAFWRYFKALKNV